MKIDKNNTTTYMTAKKRIGWSAPTELIDLVFIQYQVWILKKLDSSGCNAAKASLQG